MLAKFLNKEQYSHKTQTNFSGFQKGLKFCVDAETKKTLLWGKTLRKQWIYGSKLSRIFLFKFFSIFYGYPRFCIVLAFLFYIIVFKSHKNIEIYKQKIIISDHINCLIKNKILKCNNKDIKKINISLSIQSFFSIDFWKIISITSNVKKISSDQEFFAVSQFVFFYLLFYFYGKQNQELSIIVNDDLLPNSLGILVAGYDLNFSIALARINDGKNREIPPIPIDILFCWNKKQALENISSNYVSHIPRKVEKINIPYKDKNKSFLTVGFLLASKCSENKVIESIKNIKFNFPVKQFIIRPHPGTSSDKWKIILEQDLKEKFIVDTSKSSIEDFAKCIDLAIVGNSSSAKDILLAGKPVVSIPDFDYAPFDYHGWIKENLLYFCPEKIIDLNKIQYFYGTKEWEEILQEDINLYNKALSTQDALTYLLNSKTTTTRF